MVLLIMQFSPLHPSLLGPDILRSSLFSDILNLCYSFNVRDQMLYQHKTGPIIFLYVLIFALKGSRCEDNNRFCAPNSVICFFYLFIEH
jgi:hypothetical protein